MTAAAKKGKRDKMVSKRQVIFMHKPEPRVFICPEKF